MAHKPKRNIILTFYEAIYGALTPDKNEEADKRQREYRSFRAKFEAQRTWVEVFADDATHFFGSITFVLLQILFMLAWVAINSGIFPEFEAFDPYPYVFLAGIITCEAVFLSIFVLMSQKRSDQISDIRSEIDYQINMQAEQEITKLIKMTNDIHQHLGLAKKVDRELEKMMEKIDPDEIEELIQEEHNLIEEVEEKVEAEPPTWRPKPKRKVKR